MIFGPKVHSTETEPTSAVLGTVLIAWRGTERGLTGQEMDDLLVELKNTAMPYRPSEALAQLDEAINRMKARRTA